MTLKALRSRELERLPGGAKTVLHGGCAGSWYFEWFAERYPTPVERHFGVEAFRSAIDRCLDLARWAQRRIESSDELELLVPPTLSILCFRRHPPGLDDEDGLEAINARLVEAAQGSGDGFVSSTRLHGTYAIRLCVLNHATCQGDVERVLASLERAAPVASAPAGAGP